MTAVESSLLMNKEELRRKKLYGVKERIKRPAVAKVWKMPTQSLQFKLFMLLEHFGENEDARRRF